LEGKARFRIVSGAVSVKRLTADKSVLVCKHHIMKTYGGMEIQIHVFLASPLDGHDCTGLSSCRCTTIEKYGNQKEIYCTVMAVLVGITD
jgi:hypothetical protein